jgi:phosphotransferase system HPr-like phosphotransfer protein
MLADEAEPYIKAFRQADFMLRIQTGNAACEESFSAASILEMLSADLDCGARVVIEAVGPDEQEALDDLEALLLRFRHEEGGA